MRLTELAIGERLMIQMTWADQKIEFQSSVTDKNLRGIYASAYIHNGTELELNVGRNSGLVCNVFATDPVTNQYVSWNNVEFGSENKDGHIVYFIKTGIFNQLSAHSDRRKHDRIIINKPGLVTEYKANNVTEVIIHDISDIGVSFFAPLNFNPASGRLTVSLVDVVEDKAFNLKIACTMVRTMTKAGNTFVGCKVTEENKEYLRYGFWKRLRAKHKDEG